jgi:DNA-binding transcriptional regulator PaaX
MVITDPLNKETSIRAGAYDQVVLVLFGNNADSTKVTPNQILAKLSNVDYKKKIIDFVNSL